jgi:glycosyltransferase involved in cell wall biosynthesis
MMIVEAQASGVPVVTFASGGTPEAVAHGETGFVVPARDDRGLADALKRLLQDPALRRRFGEAARARVMGEFDLHTQGRRLEEIYDEVVAA